MLRRSFLFAAAASGSIDVTQFRADPTGKRLSTSAIQAAIDAASRTGGTVRFPAGTYQSGTLTLKSNVCLHLESGAVLRGSRDLADYPSRVPKIRSYTDTYTERSLLYAEDAENIAIEGHGLMDGQGASFHGPYKVRPYMIRMINCRHVSVSDVTLIDSPMWVQHYLACDDVSIRGVNVRSRVNSNNDGIDIDACHHVRISDCDIWSGDDAIVLKSTLDRPARDVVVTNCVLSSRCNALKLGTETNGGFENIAISNCTVYETRLSGVALEIVDGGTLDRVLVSNVVMNNVGAPVFVRLGDRGRPFAEGGLRPGAGRLRNVILRDIVASGGSRVGCAISGIPDHQIEELTLDNVHLEFVGGGTKADADRDPPENADRYPEHSMFGALPAYGLFCRHVRNLRLHAVETRFRETEERPGLVCRHVTGLRLSDCQFQGAPVRVD